MMNNMVFNKLRSKGLTSLFGCLIFSSLSNLSHGVQLPEDARGFCSNDYVNVVTDPYTEFFNGEQNFNIYRLPKNVCVRRYNTIDRFNRDNSFFVNDILPIHSDGSVAFQSVNGSEFDITDYEPVVGHFNGDHTFNDVKDSSHPYFNDYSGAHPFLIAKNAQASIKYVRGMYYIDKQLRLADKSDSVCQSGYSTVGKTKTCYAKRNRILLNAQEKAELHEPLAFTREKNTIGQDCPLGTSTASNLGSHGGICTDNKILFSNKKLRTFGISVSQASYCPPEEFFHGYVCIPVMTTFYCLDDVTGNPTGELVATVSSRMSSKHLDFPEKTVLGSLSMQHLHDFQQASIHQSATNRFGTDYLFQSLTNPSRKMQMMHVFTGENCSLVDLDRGSFSVEPVAPMW